LAYGQHFGYPITAGTDMHNISKGRELYGVKFDEPWENIFSYTLAIRAKKTFGVKTGANRGSGVPMPLERSYELLNLDEQNVHWDVADLFK
jgi:hypothetical protein